MKRHNRLASVLLASIMLSALGFARASVLAQSSATGFAIVGDICGRTAGTLAVSEMIKGWNPSFIVTAGDNCSCAPPIDEQVGRFYSDYIGDYVGAYGSGSASSRFWPALGNHDYDCSIDCDSSTCWGDYLEYFTLPGNERYYEVRRGPAGSVGRAVEAGDLPSSCLYIGLPRRRHDHALAVRRVGRGRGRQRA